MLLADVVEADVTDAEEIRQEQAELTALGFEAQFSR